MSMSGESSPVGANRNAPSSRSAPPPREGTIARQIEERTARVPSDVYLWVAAAAMGASVTFQVIGMLRGPRRELAGGWFGHRPRASASLATFVGQWVPSLLLLGIYNKIVKVAGSDRAVD
jgi:hypothetical protein